MNTKIVSLHKAIKNDVSRIEVLIAQFSEFENIKTVHDSFIGKRVNVFDSIYLNMTSGALHKIIKIDDSFRYPIYDEKDVNFILDKLHNASIKLKCIEEAFDRFTEDETFLISKVKTDRLLKKEVMNYYNEYVLNFITISNFDMPNDIFYFKFMQHLENNVYDIEEELKSFFMIIFKNIIVNNFLNNQYNIGNYISYLSDIAICAPKNNTNDVKFFKDFDNIKDFEDYFNKQSETNQMVILTNIVDEELDGEVSPASKFAAKNKILMRKILNISQF